jgi:serine/threonine protein kinase
VLNGLHKLIKREIIVHAQLQHPNIIPLLGIYRESADEPPMMVMPLMKNGSAPAFLQSFSCGDLDCAKIVSHVFSLYAIYG